MDFIFAISYSILDCINVLGFIFIYLGPKQEKLSFNFFAYLINFNILFLFKFSISGFNTKKYLVFINLLAKFIAAPYPIFFCSNTFI